MTKLFLIPIIFLVSTTCILAQEITKDFEITLPEQKIAKSFYRTIRYLDSRIDTSNMGIVQLGAFNRKSKVVAKTPFAKQLKNVIDALTDTTAENGELLFQIRQFNFAEITGAMSEKGYCYLRAELYKKQDANYRKLAAIDTVVLIKSLDVTKALFKNGSKTITDFIAKNLLQQPTTNVSYSIYDVEKIDSIEKLTIPVYTKEMYADGLYSTYASFKNQVPDNQVIVETDKDKSITSLKLIDDTGKKIKIKAKDVYSVVYKGQPFIATEYGYYPLKKVDNDFYFTGKAKITANTGDVIAASFFFGVLGGLIASDANATFEMKLDHLNGGFIRIREIRSNLE